MKKEEKKQPFLTFTLNNRKFAFDISHVVKIMYIPNTIHLASDISYLKGIVDYAEEVYPLLDTRKILKLPDTECNENTAIVVIIINNEKIALLVDSLIDILNLPANGITGKDNMFHSITYDTKDEIMNIDIININAFLPDSELKDLLKHKERYIDFKKNCFNFER